MVNERTFIFHFSAPFGKTFYLVSSSRLSTIVKVKYLGHIFYAIVKVIYQGCISGTLVYHKDILLNCLCLFCCLNLGLVQKKVQRC